MIEKDDLLAYATERGIPVDKRLGVARLREAIAEWESDAEGRVSRDFGPAVGPVDDGPEETPPEEVREGTALPVTAPAADGWPKRIAPRVWLDQQGRRYTDLGRALAGADECRRQS